MLFDLMLQSDTIENRAVVNMFEGKQPQEMEDTVRSRSPEIIQCWYRRERAATDDQNGDDDDDVSRIFLLLSLGDLLLSV
jgi:hypothetical protein